MPSATDIITRSLRLLGVLEATETPSAEDLSVGKVALDDFVDSLGLERASIFTVGRHIYPLLVGVATYTIGSGGAFNQVRPVWIDNASIRPDRTASPVAELPIGRPLNIAEWQGVTDKSSTSTWPTAFYYDYAWNAGLGLITVYPIPTSSLADLVLYTPEAASAFADLTTVYTMPPGWSRMYRYNLALELADDFGKNPSSRVERIAVQSLAAIKRANSRPTDASLDPSTPGLPAGGRFDLYTGS